MSQEADPVDALGAAVVLLSEESSLTPFFNATADIPEAPDTTGTDGVKGMVQDLTQLLREIGEQQTRPLDLTPYIAGIALLPLSAFQIALPRVRIGSCSLWGGTACATCKRGPRT